MSGLSCDRNYIVYLSWTPDDLNNAFDIPYIHDSIMDRAVEEITYDVMLYRNGQLVSSSKRTDQTTTRQVYDFEQEGQYTLRVDSINRGNDKIDYSIQGTPEFPVWMFLQAWQPRTGVSRRVIA